MNFSEFEAERAKIQEKNVSFNQQCNQMIKFIEKNDVKTLKRRKKNGSTTRK